MTNETTAQLVREFIHNRVMRGAAGELGLGGQEALTRASLVATQLVGVAVVRYVFRIEPVASTALEHLVATIGPTVQHYLTGSLPGTLPPPNPTQKDRNRT